ncbi:MAG: ABC transporter ATP-binding protein/permease [Oscillospiraceae bacterium]|nr:ABC transporter ATP-binding protein/permease [Oscillospiraceae bacterium]
MLQIQHICKEYRTGSLIQKALDDVSLNLRDSEFVAILGPSGSGKTTLLNIIGGLDRYDSGELIINGISTQKYKDKDWDSYRNHTIGFVFQSYNLIPHQSLLANVELALTISGVGKAERRRRAREALEQVGLGDQIGKKPNQLSGGQMQRVAIARALVNNPYILLADEPTGALDSETSVQVMELLREVAKNRLVVMVTHNPELAAEYATRIVKLKDGKIQSDSNRFDVVDSSPSPPSYANMGKSSMSFLTSLGLSFNNLLTKKARTLLTAFAGSIGIIGIALIMSLSNGVNDYIASVEEDTLSEYPIQITDTGFDFASLLSAASGIRTSEDEDSEDIHVVQLMTTMFSQLDSNDLEALKAYLGSRTSGVEQYVQAIEYSYGVEPLIYREDGDSVKQVNPDTTLSSMGFSTSTYGMMSSYMSLNTFYALPESQNLYIEQYDVEAGHWPENETECVLVLTSDGGISDLLLYTLGLRDSVELEKMIQQYRNKESIDTPENMGSHTYEDVLGITFRVINSADCYVYDSEYGVWTDKSDNADYMSELVSNGLPLTIVGIVQPKEDAGATFLSSGIYYSPSLIKYIAAEADSSEIVRCQLAEPTTNIFTGESFGEENAVDFNLESLFSLNADALSELFDFDANFDMSDIDLSDYDLSTLTEADLSSLGLPSLTDIELNVSEISQALDLSRLDLSAAYSQIPEPDIEAFRQALLASVSAEEMEQLAADIMVGYQDYVRENNLGDVSDAAYYFEEYMNSQEARELIADYMLSLANGEENGGSALMSALLAGYAAYAEENSYPLLTDTVDSLNDYLSSENAREIIRNGVSSILDADTAREAAAAQLQTYIQEAAAAYRQALTEQTSEIIADATEQITAQLREQTASAAEQATEQIEELLNSPMASVTEDIMTEFSERLGEAASGVSALDEGALLELLDINMNGEDLVEFLTSMSDSRTSSYKNNLQTLGYIDFDSPTEIDIYPIDFESKAAVTDILNAYNERMEASGQEEKVITYTDMVGTIMSSVTDIINMISYVLIAFVAISLVVSSIMIGVITYISVLERRKEIGILRAIGASKSNVSSVFNAETFIIGLCAGIMGIVISLLLLIPGNSIIHTLAGNTRVNAVLPAVPALLLIALSVLLTMLGGLIPSKAAAKSDPVTALRTE